MIDSHAHLTSSDLIHQIDEITKRASKLEAIINICTDKPSLEKALSLSIQKPKLYHAAATTPHDVEKEGEAFFPLVEAAARNKQLVAIGESGLDYYYEHSKKEVQKAFLIRYFSLALATSLPIIIHCRDAFSDFFELLDAHYVQNNRVGKGVLHCFTGTLEEAQQVVKRGFYLSISGIVTFKKSTELVKVAKWVPLDKLLVETDAPYLAPHPHRGKQNEPAFVQETIDFIAHVRQQNPATIAEQTAINAKKLFNL